MVNKEDKRGRYRRSSETRDRNAKALAGRSKTPEHRHSIAIARLLQETGERPSEHAVNVIRHHTLKRSQYEALTLQQLTWLLYWEWS